MNNTQEGDPYKISNAHMYFIYSFVCSKAIDIERNIGDKSEKQYCEEFRPEYGLYAKGYSFKYNKRVSRQFIINMPYLHIIEEPFKMSVNGNVKSFINKNEIDPNYTVNGENFLNFENCTIKIYEDGRGIFRFKAKLPENSPIEKIIRFMDVSSLPELLRKVENEISEQIKKIEEDLKWVELEEKIIPPEALDKKLQFVWQTPQILLHVKMPNKNFKNFMASEDSEHKRLKWIHAIINKSRDRYDTIDTSFARYFTSVNKEFGKSETLNMCYDNQWYFTLSPDVLLFISKSDLKDENDQEQTDKLEKYQDTTKWVEIRLLEIYEFLRLRWYSLIVADELLDQTIQDLSKVYKEITNLSQEDDGDNLDFLFGKVEDFLEKWIDKKCLVLRTFEDPSTQRCAGLSFNLVY